MTISLQRLSAQDLNLLRLLRNSNRECFFDDHEITMPEQIKWWIGYKAAEKTGALQFYTLILNGVTPVGFLSVKLLNSMAIENKLFEVREIGNLLVAPAYRGQGIMGLAIQEASRLYSPLTFWVAHVKDNNASSLKVFDKLGFTAVTAEEKVA